MDDSDRQRWLGKAILVGMLYLADVNRVDTVFDFSQAATGVVQARNDGREAVVPYAFLGFEFTF